MALTEAHRERLIRKYAIDPDDPRVVELVEQGHLRSVSAAEAIRLLGQDGLESGGLYLEYPDGTAFTIRLDVPARGRDGRERKYLRPIGQPNRLFVPLGVDPRGMTEIWATEGEFKALAAALRGLPVVALAGVWNWRRDASEADPLAAALTAGNEKVPDRIAILPDFGEWVAGKRWVLWYDSDIDQGHPAWPAFPRLAEQLYARGAASVKIITLPALGLEKTGLDDYILSREREGRDAAAELRALAQAAPEWVPLGDGAERYAETRLASTNPAEQVRGAAALLAAKGETVLQAALREHKIRGEVARAIRRDAQRLLEEIRERQEPRQRPRETEGRDMTERFPPLRELFPDGLPFPEPPREGATWDIRDGRVILVSLRQFGNETLEVVTPILDTVAVLTRRLAPLEAGVDAEKWEVAWYEPGTGQWRRAHVPASWLFDSAQRRWLIEAGVPISSENAEYAVLWFHCLRMAVLRGQAPVPVTATVSRCGWFEYNGKLLFVLGPEVIEPRPGTRGAAAGDREEYEPDSPDADAEVGWALDISANEQQILSGFRVKGDPAQQREFLLETAVKYPQVAFGLGCAAGAPLVRFAQAAGLSEVAGFTVLMHSGNAGRKGRQGKTAWSQVVASFWGCPEVGERLRYADRTRVHMGVLLSTCCDLTVHLEDLQKIAHEAKKAVVEEIDYLLHLVAAGMDRERGARAGGGRRTRMFKAVALATAEYDVTASIPAGSGAHDRVLKLPALLPEDCDANKEEADRISKMACTHYGHAGREYLRWLINHVNEHGTDEVVRSIEAAIRVLTDRLPSDERRGSAGRLAKRAGIALAGLLLWLESIGADDQTIRQAVDSFLAGWAMVCSEIPVEDLAERAVEVIQAYVSENREQFHGFRTPGERPPARWLGALAKVAGRECIVLFENALAEVLERRGLDINQVKKALRAAGKIMTVTEDGKERMTVSVCKADLRGRGIAIPLAVLELEEEEVGDE